MSKNSLMSIPNRKFLGTKNIENMNNMNAIYQEFEDQLSDVLYKRAQAKLMVENDPYNLNGALTDILKVYL
jgi:hypothetical protein